jgi:3-methylcrotonyl-CoA carboxylase alpha subunit
MKLSRSLLKVELVLFILVMVFYLKILSLLKRLRQAGLIFVGPDFKAIELMGQKDAAKKAMFNAGIPIVPGYHGKDQSDKTLVREAASIGYPVLIKAVAGGGGKGMRLVEDPKDFLTLLTSARTEAEKAFWK